MRSTWASLRLLPLLSIFACAAQDDAAEPVRGLPLTDAFPDTTTILLDEDPDDPIGSIGVFLEFGDGGFAAADRMLPRVRRFAASGRRTGTFGAQGEGPGEFRTTAGLIETADGELAVVDSRLGRVTILTPQLTLDTVIRVTARPRGPALSWGDSTILLTSSAARSSAVSAVTDGWGPLWEVPSPGPSNPVDYPYWGSVGVTLIASSPSTLFTGFSLRYPVYLYDRRGRLVDSLDTAPASFRQASVPERGAFAGPGAMERLDAWQATFDVIADLSVVNDTLLMVTRLRTARSPAPRRGAQSGITASTSTTSRRAGSSSRTSRCPTAPRSWPAAARSTC